MFDDIKDEMTIPIPLTGHAINFGKWAMAEGKRYNYTRIYAEEKKMNGVSVFHCTFIVQRKRRWD